MAQQISLWSSPEEPQEAPEIDVQPVSSPEPRETPVKDLWGLQLGQEVVILATGKVGVVQAHDLENRKVLVIDDYGAGRGHWFDPVTEVELREWME